MPHSDPNENCDVTPARPVPVRSALIVTKARNDNAHQLGEKVRRYLMEQHVEASCVENSQHTDPTLESPVARVLRNGPRPDCIIVLGGDGTMLSVARQPEVEQIPLIGLNFGKIGFLTDLCPESWRDGLGALLAGKYDVFCAMALMVEVFRSTANGETKVWAGRVVNDVVINRGKLARLANLEVLVDDFSLDCVRADGVMVSTPQGTTGYAVSAAGPLVHPRVESLTVTAICAFLNRFPPMVLPADATVTIIPRQSPADLYLTLDGQEGLPLEEGDRIVVSRAVPDLAFVRLGEESYFQRLIGKGFLGNVDPTSGRSSCTGVFTTEDAESDDAE
ncbi:NAD(+)/NADH kinase [Oceanidesulfovibrio marinus]|uniref:NAD kinase n=1 Tax=Oceanidesulfovibrio marinus TaxID=370038 RepID=A0A6P1ZKF9_9BACT|nr:NAD(+)/NADH kinase [Oceanidesulfovibrio marinus]QJT10516.1 NAD(+)/NADH kinase [Oceanidesulfovibrio marinus]TVM34249.1 hypothetical protein DQK91_10210 [Oceanidesulfovibrio marinus]